MKWVIWPHLKPVIRVSGWGLEPVTTRICWFLLPESLFSSWACYHKPDLLFFLLINWVCGLLLEIVVIFLFDSISRASGSWCGLRLPTSIPWIIMLRLLSESSREEAIIIKTVIRVSSDVIPINTLSMFFVRGGYLKFFLDNEVLCFLRLFVDPSCVLNMVSGFCMAPFGCLVLFWNFYIASWQHLGQK